MSARLFLALAARGEAVRRTKRRAGDQVADQLDFTSMKPAVEAGRRPRPVRPPRPTEVPRRAASPRPRRLAETSGRRIVGTSDIARRHRGEGRGTPSRKKCSREWKWNAASTSITPSNEPSTKGSRQASQTARGRASRRRHALLPAGTRYVHRRKRPRPRDLRDHQTCAVSHWRRRGRHHRPGSSAAIRSTSRRTATGASTITPSPSHRPRFNHPRASARRSRGRRAVDGGGIRPYRSTRRRTGRSRA